MTSLDIAQLLQPISETAPCGENLEYDAAYLELETASRGKPEQEYGDTKIAAEPPDWDRVKKLGSQLLTRTKDLRIACLLTQGLLATEGLTGLLDGLRLTQAYIENDWAQIHPQLDPDDQDATARISALASLDSPASTVRLLRDATLISVRMLGEFSLKDIEIARGELPPHDSERPSVADIEASFAEIDLDELRQKTQTAQQALTHATTIETLVTNHVGAADSVSLENLSRNLQHIHAILLEHFTRRAPQEQLPVEEVAAVLPVDEVPGDQAAAAPAAAAPAAPAEIRSRDDVIRTLDRLCEYYDRYEPSSPLPLLLRRAQRLASMSFLDIIAELTPDALSQAKAVGGMREE